MVFHHLLQDLHTWLQSRLRKISGQEWKLVLYSHLSYFSSCPMVQRVLDQSISTVNHHGAIEAKGIIQRVTEHQWGRAEPILLLSPSIAGLCTCSLCNVPRAPLIATPPALKPSLNPEKGPACRKEVMDSVWSHWPCSHQPHTHCLFTSGSQVAHLTPGLVTIGKSRLIGSCVGYRPPTLSLV